ncbi:hypothetical protein ZIOFF_032804 [Zingiber officinale]|uniref:L-gulonolactone oxidase n=1 Tax=Zingiber officinale TaxID=94328 RepID=A0A8J5GW62_ZINOF|nr:hypothetical protein ZIOFF_032804 [Zingiber officinale]
MHVRGLSSKLISMAPATAFLLPLLSSVILLSAVVAVRASPPGPVVTCRSGNSNCTVTNAYGAFPDRSTCLVASVAYPGTEQELLAAVSAAAAKGQHMKALSAYSHSIPKLSCPGGPAGRGLVISTVRLNRTVSSDPARFRMTFEGGIKLRELLDAAASRGMALPHSPYWEGVTLGGLLSTGSHGSSAFGKGSAVHEYVVGMRLVVPTAEPVADTGYYAKVVSLGEDDRDLLAAKVSLGVLGVISQVTLQLEPMFKRSVTNRVVPDVAFENSISSFAATTPYGDIIWYPSQAVVVYRDDFKLPVSTPGTGLNDFIGFRAQPTLVITSTRAAGGDIQKLAEENEDTNGKCVLSKLNVNTLLSLGMGFKNSAGVIGFTGYPVIGNQSDIQSAGSCLRSREDGLLSACAWDPRFRGLFYHQTTVSVPLVNATAFIADVKRIRDASPTGALCGIELNLGFFMRFVRASSAYLGKTADSVDIDITYYRPRNDPRRGRLHEDVLEEIEQLALFKYGALPHWGKNRHVGFVGVKEKLGEKVEEFVKVMEKYDGQGLFSSAWTDALLGLRGREVLVEADGCALEGLCICSADKHCAPDQGYRCRPGRVYQESRVCRKIEEAGAGLIQSA